MAAGLGFKTFTTGEVLTAADTNGYLMQGVLVFASAAARDAAITSPQEGQFAYLKDTDVTTYYTGSAWTSLVTTGMTNPMTTTGDIIYSSSGSTPARLGIGTAGQVLKVNSGATAPEWGAVSAGKVLQVVSAVTTTQATITSSTFTDTNLTVSITPSATSSKVLILVSQGLLLDQNANQANFDTALFRGTSNIFQAVSSGIYSNNATSVTLNLTVAIAYLDSPGTTSSTTYKTQGKKDGNTQGRYQLNGTASSIIAMEIGA